MTEIDQRGQTVNGPQINFAGFGKPPSRLHQLRAVTGMFTGREAEMEILAERLLRARSVAITEAIEGMGGIGKTELAICLATKLIDQFPDAQIVVNLGAHSGRTPLTSQQALEECVRAFYPQQQLPAEEQDLKKLYLSWLYKKRAIIILDDAVDDSQIEPLFPPEGSVAIVTSRRRLTSTNPLQLGVFSRTESVNLLRKYRESLEDAQAYKLARVCGDLPLALNIAGSYLRFYEKKSVESYLELLGDLGLSALKWDRKLEDGRPMNVEIILEASYLTLTTDEQAAFRALGIMPAGFDEAAALSVMKLDRGISNFLHPSSNQQLQTVLYRFAALNLIQNVGSRFEFHDLMRQFALAKLKSKKHETKLTMLRHAKHFVRTFCDAHSLGIVKFLTVADFERIHLDVAIGNLYDLNEWSLLTDILPIIAETGNLRFKLAERLKWANYYLESAVTLRNSQSELKALYNLGWVYHDAGKNKSAIDPLQKALKLAEQLQNIRIEVGTLILIGSIYQQSWDNPAQCLPYYHKALTVALMSNDPVMFEQALVAHGSFFMSIFRFAEAAPWFERALIFCRLTNNVFQEGNVLSTLSAIYEETGRHEEALHAARRAVDLLTPLGGWKAESAKYSLESLEKGENFTVVPVEFLSKIAGVPGRDFGDSFDKTDDKNP